MLHHIIRTSNQLISQSNCKCNLGLFPSAMFKVLFFIIDSIPAYDQSLCNHLQHISIICVFYFRFDSLSFRLGFFFCYCDNVISIDLYNIVL